jgi:hypothetical protein
MNTAVIMIVTIHDIGVIRNITNNLYAFDNLDYARDIMLNDTQDFIDSLPDGEDYRFTETRRDQITIETNTKSVTWSIGYTIIENEQDESTHYNGFRFDFKR